MITPCVSVCKIDKETKVCLGCNRTRDEIAMWSKMSDEERLDIMNRLGYGNKRLGREERMRRYEKG